MARIGKEERLTVAKGILANVLHDLSPGKSVKEWQDYIDEYGSNAKEFFGSNGSGYEEYLSFTRTFDKDSYERAKKIKERKLVRQ